MIDAKNFETCETLKNGTAVTVRAVRPADKELLAEAFGNLESETVYTRFFHHKSHLTDAELARATELDFVKDVGLVVTVPGPEREVIIGAARYSRLPVEQDGQLAAEVAFTVEEDYQGQGIAGRLLGHLARIAREQGITSFVAEVLAGNKAMLGVFKRSGLALRTTYQDGDIHLTLSL